MHFSSHAVARAALVALGREFGGAVKFVLGVSPCGTVVCDALDDLMTRGRLPFERAAAEKASAAAAMPAAAPVAGKWLAGASGLRPGLSMRWWGGRRWRIDLYDKEHGADEVRVLLVTIEEADMIEVWGQRFDLAEIQAALTAKGVDPYADMYWRYKWNPLDRLEEVEEARATFEAPAQRQVEEGRRGQAKGSGAGGRSKGSSGGGIRSGDSEGGKAGGDIHSGGGGGMAKGFGGGAGHMVKLA